MKILIVGSGGREHALAWKLRASPKVSHLYALPGSAGIGQTADCVAGNPLEIQETVRTCGSLGIDLAVVGPEAPLAAGLADALQAAGIRVFGPTQAAARLESSKSFAKAFMANHRIPTARYETFQDPEMARTAAAELELPIVVKADGLAAGKGVRVCRTRRKALEAVQDFMVRRSLGEAGARVVLEERLEGPEITVMAFCDGNFLRPMPVSRDHKRLQDGDVGPNTGGMGAFCPVQLPEDTAARIREEILERTLHGLRADRLDYRGILYCGLMLTAEGPKLLEFNVRFGDPETQAALPLVKTDLLDLLEATVDRRLAETPLQVEPGHAVCVVLASEGYPAAAQVGRRITGLELVSDAILFHAATAPDPSGTAHASPSGACQVTGALTGPREIGWRTSGGRVLNVVGTGPTLGVARAQAYAAARKIHFDGMHFRSDIAAMEPAHAWIDPVHA